MFTLAPVLFSPWEVLIEDGAPVLQLENSHGASFPLVHFGICFYGYLPCHTRHTHCEVNVNRSKFYFLETLEKG